MDSQGPSSHFNERARSMRPSTAATEAELPPSSAISLATYAPYPQQASSTQGWAMTGNPGAPFMAMESRYRAIQNPPQFRVESFDPAFFTQVPPSGINMNGIDGRGVPLGQAQSLGLSREPSLTGYEQTSALSRGPSFTGSDRSFIYSRRPSYTGVDSELVFEGRNGGGYGNHLPVMPHDQYAPQTYGESLAGGSSSFSTMDDMFNIEQLKCRWEDCDYTGNFSGKGTLMRHIKSKHVSPNRFECKLCGNTFGRKDKVMEHLRSKHAQTQGF
ncbi:hypothetical protein N7493_000679 [Penicillium malachiteum]|uniref:C2H2-type domain-containing protein n=1 Tax=Penicillium malachiteum TaxID=1324776 RepID=A0AAD6HXM3_9EURO|nr:hypothetical protein N7493_000679 [Penicillium malachiteum]